jgi:predicted enzyme related to lactoylglutathione lyase
LAGKAVHFEIPAQDTSRAQEFYKSLFGWQFQAMEGPSEYHMAQPSDDTGSAVFPGDTGAIRVYFDVDEINAGASRLQELGGKADEPQPVPGMGWFVTGTDTEGNPIGLWQSDPSASAPESPPE